MGSLAKRITKSRTPLTSLSITAAMLIGSLNMQPAAQAASSSHLLSYEGAAYASSMEGGLSPDKAVDGDLDSRWGSAFSADQQWIYVDLGAPATIDKVILRWENAYSKSYKIQVSDDESEWKDIYANAAGDGGVDTIALTGSGRYVRMLSLQRAGNYGVSLHEFEVYGTGGSNPQPIVLGPDVAMKKPVVASSYQIPDKDKPLLLPEYAVDGDPKTRWSSRDTSDESLYVDLGSVREIGRVRLNWENAAGRVYDLQVSDDAEHWTTVYREMNGHEGWMDAPIYASGRYVRMTGISRTTSYGYSLYDFNVYDYVPGDTKPVYDIPALPTASVVDVGKGSYLTSDISMPQPRPPINKTADVAAPIASNDWWQSVLIKNLSDSLVTLPLKSKYTSQGLGILNPGAGWVNKDGNSQAADGAPDFFLSAGNIGASRAKNVVSGYSDWSATVVFSDNDTKKMETTLVKGSPYLYSEFSDPTTPNLYFPVATTFFGDDGKPALAADGASLTDGPHRLHRHQRRRLAGAEDRRAPLRRLRAGRLHVHQSRQQDQDPPRRRGALPVLGRDAGGKRPELFLPARLRVRREDDGHAGLRRSDVRSDDQVRSDDRSEADGSRAYDADGAAAASMEANRRRADGAVVSVHPGYAEAA